MVKKACVCSKSEAKDALKPVCIPRKSREKGRANIVSPYRRSILKGICGLLIKKIAGMLVKKKREKQSSKGGISCRPTWMTTKLNPQITTTKIASAR